MVLFSSKKKEAGFDDDSDLGTESSRLAVLPQPFGRNDILVIATYGKIYAVHKRHGSRLWRQKFPTSAMGGVVSVFITDHDKLVVAGNGKTAALDLFTGETLWVNKMKGCGYEEVGTIVTPSKAMPPTSQAGNDTYDRLPEYSSSTTPSEPFRPVVISCTNGKCLGIDAESGQELWRFNCPKGGFKIPTALVDTPPDFHQAPNVFVGCGTMLYCLQARTGQVQWSTKISNAIVGQGYMTMATPWSSRLVAEAHTAFNQFPSAQQEDAARERRNRSN